MSSIKSSQKITTFNGIADATIQFHEEVAGYMNALKASAEEIKVPVFDRIYNGMALALNSFNNYSDESAQHLATMATKYSEREGYGPQAQAAFEECAQYVKRMEGAGTKFAELELSTGLDENVTEETVTAYMKALKAVVAAKDPYLQKLVNIIGENSEADTQEIYANIGAGIEQVANAFVDVFEANSADVNKFNVSLDEVNNAIKSTASSMSDAGRSTATKVQPVDTL